MIDNKDIQIQVSSDREGHRVEAVYSERDSVIFGSFWDFAEAGDMAAEVEENFLNLLEYLGYAVIREGEE